MQPEDFSPMALEKYLQPKDLLFLEALARKQQQELKKCLFWMEN